MQSSREFDDEWGGFFSRILHSHRELGILQLFCGGFNGLLLGASNGAVFGMKIGKNSPVSNSNIQFSDGHKTIQPNFCKKNYFKMF